MQPPRKLHCVEQKENKMKCQCNRQNGPTPKQNFYLLCDKCANRHMLTICLDHRTSSRSSKMEELKRKATIYGATHFGRSDQPGKKFKVIYNNKVLHFGDSSMQDFTQHHDTQRRKNFKQRMKGVGGGKTYLDKNSPLFWSYHLLW